MEVVELIFRMVEPALEVAVSMADGQRVHVGDHIFEVKGPARGILQAERLALNCLQRMSGIATYTDHLNQLISHTKAKLLDTRKTTPNFRMMEKWAVAIGGGHNHRYGLYDMVMLKDNHIDYAGGISAAVSAARAYLEKHQLSLRVEVETRNLKEVQEALDTQAVDIIMLDNMSPQLMRKAVEIINGQCIAEASGGIDEKNIVSVAECGVDFISCGALTHSYKSMDISLRVN